MSNRLYTFFSYYGGKFRAAKHYPLPQYGTIIEPFAGAAGYSQRYWNRNIILYEINPVIYALWSYLIKVTPEEILRLPEKFDHTDELNICQEAKYLIGFWSNHATVSPSKKPSSWMKGGLRPNSFWGKSQKQRLAGQISNIKHWKIYNNSYTEIDNTKCTWFIDPPYNNAAGKLYKYSNIDYNYLADWCRERHGQTIVCEQDGATWLPFEFLANIKSSESSRGKHKSAEAIWTNIKDIKYENNI